MSNCLQTDVLIIGSGIAGATAALTLADSNIDVTLVTRTHDPHESNTYYAQGGIIYRGQGDSHEALSNDIIRAGAGHSSPHAVSVLANLGPELVQDFLLKKLNVPFDRTPKGELALTLEGGHSIPRMVHGRDHTGKIIEQTLIQAISSHPHVTLLTSHTSIDLLTPPHHSRNRLAVYDPPSCVGAYLLNQATGQVVRCLAKRTILATGGLGQIFLCTTNPPGARGDGLAMAYRAGARVINAEFVQFHPTTFFHPHAPRFLISEAVRGEGARLVHANGEPFMQKYDAKWKDLAPRDVVARSIHYEMLATSTPNVYLDLCSYIPKDKIMTHFPTIYKMCLDYGVDITRDLVPVVPGAHYFCGGVWANEWGQTTMDRLYAIGEVACTGLHGANRLASTSLLEGLVWGHQAALHIQKHLAEDALTPPDDIPPWQDGGLKSPDPALISQDLNAIKHMMWNYVGLVRNTQRLERALRELRHLETEIEQFYRTSFVTDELIGLRNAIRSAVIVAAAAWENKNSIGCHYREYTHSN